MGLLKKLSEKFFKGFFYVVDIETLKDYLRRNMEFAVENDLVFSTELNIYFNSEKHRIQAFNLSSSENENEGEEGECYTFDDIEFRSVDELISQKLSSLPQYFKIELTLGDEVELNEYKANHPELNPEDY